MKILVVIPTQTERDCFVQACRDQGHQAETKSVGRLLTTYLPRLDITVASGGLGKAQFAVQTQHLIDAAPWDWVTCAGAAGALVDTLGIGDVLIATETVEHDIHNKFGKPLLPCFLGSEEMLSRCREFNLTTDDFRVHYGGVASGDEDVVELDRRQALYRRTGSLAVAWEGAGGARACQFSGVPYLEIRGISDNAHGHAAQDFEKNLPSVMHNVSRVILSWADGS